MVDDSGISVAAMVAETTTTVDVAVTATETTTTVWL